MSSITRKGKTFILINPDRDVSIKTLCDMFGENTIKVNHQPPLGWTVEALNGINGIFEQAEDFSQFEWAEID